MKLIKSGFFASLVLSAVIMAVPTKNPTPTQDELVSQFYQKSKEVKNNLEKILKSKDFSAFCAARGEFLTAVQDFTRTTKLIGIPNLFNARIGNVTNVISCLIVSTILGFGDS